jgi:putative ABC transport system substrate-binding protein
LSRASRGRAAAGLSLQQSDIAGKRLELLHNIIPNLGRLAIIANLGVPGSVGEMREVQGMAPTLGLDVITLGIRQPTEIATAFDALKDRAQALYVVNDSLTVTNRTLINTLALAARLPTMHGSREQVEAGGLISYGANFPDLFRRAADFVDKILRGAKPSEIPVEQPTQFELVINLRAAKALGLDIPPSLLARADEVIE